MRDIVNKKFDRCETAFLAGWDKVVYFMIGLPGETDADVRHCGDSQLAAARVVLRQKSALVLIDDF